MQLAHVALVTLLWSIGAFAQTPGLGETRPVDPAARDEATTVVKKPAAPPTSAERSQSDNDRTPSRCAEVSGTSRDDCLRDGRAAGAGATRRPEPPSAPPPQNPR
ncbi:MAG TPA: hypothetical protein VFJ70_22930 [Burkholderiales bacterium]|nr:hypothetical protein [Burkholderiales bacterium]